MKKQIMGKPTTYKFVELKENVEAYGVYDSKTSTILLDKNLKGEDLTQVTLHEEFHCVIDRVYLNVTSLSDDVQEVICEALSQFVVQHYHLKPKKR